MGQGRRFGAGRWGSQFPRRRGSGFSLTTWVVGATLLVYLILGIVGAIIVHDASKNIHIVTVEE